jgi:hypothetical protein
MAMPKTIALVPPVTKPPVRKRPSSVESCTSCNRPVLDNVDCECAA